MKKNKIMRFAALVLVLTLLSTSVIGGTFAKYTTQDAASDSARVAKWGVELQVVGNLYGDSYDDGIVVSAEDAGEAIAVQAVDYANGGDNDVVAPGTKNENGFTFSLEGKPEVDGKVTTEMKVQNVFLAANTYAVMIPVAANTITAENYDEFTGLYVKTSTTAFQVAPATFKAGTTYYTLEDEVEVADTYYPVKYNLAGHTSFAGANINEDSLKAVADKIAAQLDLTAEATDKATTVYTGVKTFETNTDLATWKLDGLRLTWKWDFENQYAKDKEGDEAYWTDKADTILGMLENTSADVEIVKKTGETTFTNALKEYEDYCLETSFDLDITVTQVD